MGHRVLRPALTWLAGTWGLAAALSLTGCGGSGLRQEIRVVGSSTVYPFTTTVAERFAQNFPDYRSPIVESTGTGSGLKLFCDGVGGQFPDIANASRRIKRSEFEACARHGVHRIVEVPVGVDGLVLIESARRPTGFNLTLRDVYAALAKAPFGRPQTAQTWHDVNPALPAVRIQVYGPPPTSGTRDSFVELMLNKGCETDPAMTALKGRSEDEYKRVCSTLREDGAFIEAGENDNLLVQKVSENGGAVGILGFSFMEENRDKVRGIPIDGVAPTAGDIQSLHYPGSRPLFIYVKGEHLDVVPGLREFLLEYSRGWTPGGYLRDRGLIPSPDATRAGSDRQVLSPQPLTGEGLG